MGLFSTSRRPSGLLVSLATIAVAGAIAGFRGATGESFNLTTFVAALPIVGVTFAVGAAIWLRLTGSATRAALPRRRSSPFFGIVAAIAGLGGATYLFGGAEAATRAYAADASCRAGFTAASDGTGACRLANAFVTDAFTLTRRRGHTYNVRVQLNDGSRTAIELAYEERGNVYDGVVRNNERAATVQYFHDDIVRVATPAGVAETSYFPARRARSIALFGIAVGALGSLTALAFALRRA